MPSQPNRRADDRNHGAEHEFDVVVVGSLNLDLVARAARHPSPGETISGSSYAEFAGGKGLNQAVAAARSGARVALVGAVGADTAGEVLRNVVRFEGIADDWLVTRSAEATGRALITVDDDGENSIIVIAGSNATVAVDELPTCAVVLAQLETTVAAVEDAFEIAHARGATTILNPAPAMRLPDDLVDRCDVLIPNEHEVDLLGGREAMAERVQHLVVTLGSDGADHIAAGTYTRVEPFAVAAIDTTGAGDAFCGALACRLALGDRPDVALRFASAAGALATTTAGAVPSQPRRADTLALLES